MTTSSLRCALLAGLLSLPLACANKAQKLSPQPSGACPAELDPETVVATYSGGKKITARQLDAEIAGELLELEQRRFQLKSQAAEKIALEALLEEEATRRQLTKEALLKLEVEDKVPPPSEEEMKRLFEQNQGQLPPGATFDQFRERIESFLLGPKRERRMREYAGQLKEKAGLQILLQPPAVPRKQVEAKGPSRGPQDAKVTILEFSDFECPYCSRAHDTVEELMQAYAGKVRLVFRHYPLPFHSKAKKAAEASLCAHEQGKFWEYHDRLFQNQAKLEVAELKEHARALGLEAGKFSECLDSGRHAKTVQADMEAGQQAGVKGTPAFFINGILLSGAQPAEEFKKVIDPELGKH